MSQQPVIQATDVVAGYLPGVNILNGCNLVAYPGEMIGIIGPNGAGKSTLLKAMFGLVKVHSRGNRSMATTSPTSRPTRLVEMGVGFVPQTNNVFPSLTIEENLRMGLFMRPKKVTERLAAMWDLFPVLSDRRNQRAGALSGGEQQSLAMARALMMEPSVLLLDEPSAGLSPVRQGRDVHPDAQDQQDRRLRGDGRAERPALPPDRRPWLCARPGRDAYTGTGRELANDPKVIEALPRHAGQGRRHQAPDRSGLTPGAPCRHHEGPGPVVRGLRRTPPARLLSPGQPAGPRTVRSGAPPDVWSDHGGQVSWPGPQPRWCTRSCCPRRTCRSPRRPTTGRCSR
ncbi:MAG: ATP-binding cassette domain-containing protein [Nocardioidaceae bacterium]